MVFIPFSVGDGQNIHLQYVDNDLYHSNSSQTQM